MMRYTSTPGHPKKKLPVALLIKVGFILFVVLSMLNFYENFQQISAMKQQVVDLESRIKQARMEKERLASVVEKMDTEAYIERIAREELGLVKKGEVLIITVEE